MPLPLERSNRQQVLKMQQEFIDNQSIKRIYYGSPSAFVLMVQVVPVHTVSGGHHPSSPDQGSSTGVVIFAARHVLQRDLKKKEKEKRHQTALEATGNTTTLVFWAELFPAASLTETHQHTLLTWLPSEYVLGESL